MAKDRSFHDYVMHDLLAGINGITSRAMFGGWGIYKNGVIFAVIADGELYFKTDEASRAEFEKAGSHPFTYAMEGRKPVTMSYWLLPPYVMEDQDELRKWIERSVLASKKRRP